MDVWDPVANGAGNTSGSAALSAPGKGHEPIGYFRAGCASAGPAGRAQPAYSERARSYDQKTSAFQSYRRAVIEAFPVRPGQVVLDVGAGTGLCSGLLQEKVGPQGGVVGIEESPEMAAVARERIAGEGWRNVTVVESPAEDAQIPVTADAAVFCAVHDILQSPDALRNILTRLRPGGMGGSGRR